MSIYNRSNLRQATMPDKNKSEAASDTADKPVFSLISNEKLLQLYAAMVRQRALEARLFVSLALLLEEPIGASMVMGSEASVVGATIDLVRGDAIVPDIVKLLADLANGASIRRFPKLVEVFADHFNLRRSNPALLCLQSALGAARIRRRKRSGRVVVAFPHTQETVRPTWRRSLGLAVREKLPIVFVALSDSGEDRPEASIAGLPAIVVDGDDAVAVYRVASEAVARARRGLGPTLIECKPYFVEADAKRRLARLRNRRPVQPRLRDDSIASMETYLRRKGLFTAQARSRIETAFGEELDAAAGTGRGPGRINSTC